MPNKLRRVLLRQLRKMRFLPPRLFAHFYYEYHTGKKLNLGNPKEFNEKIQWYKVFYHPKILNQLVDKYAVRAYVKEKIGDDYLNEVYGIYNTPDAISYDDLPNQFVVKATHTSSHNLIVTDKNQLNRVKTAAKFNKWLSKNQYYRMGQEWAYKDVEPRLIIEKFLKEDGRDSLIDYKFYCFNGIVKFADVHVDRTGNHQQGCFDLDFNLLPFRKKSKHKDVSSDIKKPSNYKEMIRLAELLATNLPFVRVDFYSVNGKTIFGEMTFYPSDGRKDFYPDKYNSIIGDYFKLPELKNGQKEITTINNIP